MAQTKSKRTRRKPLHCGKCESYSRRADHKETDRCALICMQCEQYGLRSDHKETDKCMIWCSHCGRNGHHMSDAMTERCNSIYATMHHNVARVIYQDFNMKTNLYIVVRRVMSQGDKILGKTTIHYN